MSALTIREEREAQEESRLHFAFLVLALVVLVAIFIGCAVWIGKSWGRMELQSEIDTRPKLTRAMPAPVAAATLLTCTKQGLREYLHACGKRETLGRITGTP